MYPSQTLCLARFVHYNGRLNTILLRKTGLIGERLSKIEARALGLVDYINVHLVFVDSDRISERAQVQVINLPIGSG